MGKKLTFEYVENFFKEQKCKLLETEYINAHTKMKYKCSCGNDSDTNFNKFPFYCVVMAKPAMLELSKPQITAALIEIFVKSGIIK